MSVIEIYSCKPGQKLKEGRLDYNHDIATREEAEADAKRRCQIDPGLAKVAYYAVGDDGRFRMLCSYTNPKPLTAKPRPLPAGAVRRRPVAIQSKPPKSFLQKILALFR
jgi:hypothetical protein